MQVLEFVSMFSVCAFMLEFTLFTFFKMLRKIIYGAEKVQDLGIKHFLSYWMVEIFQDDQIFLYFQLHT